MHQLRVYKIYLQWDIPFGESNHWHNCLGRDYTSTPIRTSSLFPYGVKRDHPPRYERARPSSPSGCTSSLGSVACRRQPENKHTMERAQTGSGREQLEVQFTNMKLRDKKNLSASFQAPSVQLTLMLIGYLDPYPRLLGNGL